MDIKEFCAQFATQKKPAIKCGNVYSEGAIAYSYGSHYPMAILRGNRAFINSTSYSMSTSRQVSRMRCALNSAGYTITERDTDAMRALVSAARP